MGLDEKIYILLQKNILYYTFSEGHWLLGPVIFRSNYYSHL